MGNLEQFDADTANSTSNMNAVGLMLAASLAAPMAPTVKAAENTAVETSEMSERDIIQTLNNWEQEGPNSGLRTQLVQQAILEVVNGRELNITESLKGQLAAFVCEVTTGKLNEAQLKEARNLIESAPTLTEKERQNLQIQVKQTLYGEKLPTEITEALSGSNPADPNKVFIGWNAQEEAKRMAENKMRSRAEKEAKAAEKRAKAKANRTQKEQQRIEKLKKRCQNGAECITPRPIQKAKSQARYSNVDRWSVTEMETGEYKTERRKKFRVGSTAVKGAHQKDWRRKKSKWQSKRLENVSRHKNKQRGRRQARKAAETARELGVARPFDHPDAPTQQQNLDSFLYGFLQNERELT